MNRKALWLDKWKRAILIDPLWSIVDSRGNGFVFRHAYVDAVADPDDPTNIIETNPVLGVLCSVMDHDGDEWGWISYSAQDIRGPRPPTPSEVTKVSEKFCGNRTTYVTAPKNFRHSLAKTNPLVKEFFFKLYEREKDHGIVTA